MSIARTTIPVQDGGYGNADTVLAGALPCGCAYHSSVRHGTVWTYCPKHSSRKSK